MQHAPAPRSPAVRGPTALAALVATIEASPIRVAARAADAASLPDWAPGGYDRTDIEVLEWIASQRRGRPGPGFLLRH